MKMWIKRLSDYPKFSLQHIEMSCYNTLYYISLYISLVNTVGQTNCHIKENARIIDNPSLCACVGEILTSPRSSTGEANLKVDKHLFYN